MKLQIYNFKICKENCICKSSHINDSRGTEIWAFKWWCKLNSPIFHFKQENQNAHYQIVTHLCDSRARSNLALPSIYIQIYKRIRSSHGNSSRNFKTIFLKLLYHQQPFFWRTLCIHFRVLLQKHLTLYEHFPSARKFENVSQQFSPVSRGFQSFLLPFIPRGV